MSHWIVPPGTANRGPILELEDKFADTKCEGLSGPVRDAFRSGRIMLLRDAILKWGKMDERRTQPYVEEFFAMFVSKEMQENETENSHYCL